MKIRYILLFVFIITAIFSSTAVIAAENETGTDINIDSEAETESVIAEFSNGVELRDAEVTDGEAVVTLYAPPEADRDRLTITDGTSTNEFTPREDYTLRQGENRYSLRLANPDIRFVQAGVSIDTGGDLYQWTETGTDLRDIEDVEQPFLLSVGGMLFLFVSILGVGQLSKRARGATNKLKL